MKPFTAWVGFVDGKPAVVRTSDGYCEPPDHAIDYMVPQYEVFAKKYDAEVRYADVRKVVILLERAHRALRRGEEEKGGLD